MGIRYGSIWAGLFPAFLWALGLQGSKEPQPPGPCPQTAWWRLPGEPLS